MGDKRQPVMKPVPVEQTVFAQALLLATPEARASYLDSACGPDLVLRRRVEALLHANESAGDFLEKPAGGLRDAAGTVLLDAELMEKPGDRLGRYKLLEKIGEGGCGVVYMAEQEEPVHRRVAFKILKLGMDTRSVVARFEAERQALALMDHPNIARVFDGGATPTGRPYFVMELVRGVRITEFCEEARLSMTARLRLFIQVCHAIQHAHQKGIIHRDLKPSNILVTVNDGAAVPKVIDFGIAKATGHRLTDKTLFTQFHCFLGTPAYTSPEQAEMSSVDVDTRSDLYSLGVLLYELLTGCTPFDGEELLRSGLDELRRVIRDEEPVKPSTRLTQELARAASKQRAAVPQETEDGALARRRYEQWAQLVKVLPGDLDCIVMKCLEKDRARRYETASGIAADVQRHLDNEPILARPPGHAYRFGKWVRRNRGLFGATAAVTIALLAGLMVSTWQAVRAHRGEARANAALADLRASAPAYAAQAQALAANEHFAEALEKLDRAIQLRPDSVEYVLAKGNLLEGQLRFDDAAPVYRAALRLDPNNARAQTNLFLCEKLRGLDRAQPEWPTLIDKLYSVMISEERPAGELKLILRPVFDHAKKHLSGLSLFTGHSLDQRLTFRQGKYLMLDLTGIPIDDLGPLVGLPLHYLYAQGTPVTDLRPLQHVPLMNLDIFGTRTLDVEPLREIRTLRSLNLGNTGVTNLAPLRGLSLRWVHLSGTRVADISPLRGMPLKVLRLEKTLVRDLSPLAGMPLYELDCGFIPAVDLSPLKDCPKLSSLILARSPARDFSPLQDCRSLTALVLNHTAIADLSLFRQLKLGLLCLDDTSVRDLSPLAGMPLATLSFHDTEITNVAPLLQCPTLQTLGLSRAARNVALLQALPNLRRISWHRDSRGEPRQTAAEFWAAFAAHANAHHE